MVCQKNSSKSALLFLLAYLFQLINTTAAWTNAADPVSIKTQVDITQPTLGDILTYSIRVNHDTDIVIHTPEYVIPEGFEKVGYGKNNPRKVKKEFESMVSLETFVTKENIASMALFLLSDESKNISGQVMTIDGNTERMN